MMLMAVMNTYAMMPMLSPMASLYTDAMMVMAAMNTDVLLAMAILPDVDAAPEYPCHDSDGCPEH
jgi:hypothetical protein